MKIIQITGVGSVGLYGLSEKGSLVRMVEKTTKKESGQIVVHYEWEIVIKTDEN